MKNLLHIISHLVFWVWNFTFIGLMYLWLLPEAGFDLWQAARSGEIELTFTISFIALLIVPLVSTVLGLVRLRKYPILLMRLFYGVEAPLFTLCLLRLFLLRELTLASGFTLAIALLSIAMFGIELLSGYSAYRPRLAWVQMIGHSFILLVGLYIGALLLLYSLPVLVAGVFGFIIGFFKFGWLANAGWVLEDFFRNPISNLGSILLSALVFIVGGGSVLVFVSMPYVFSNFYVRAWARIRSAFGKQHSEQQSWAITGITIALCSMLFVGVQAQPQAKAFELLQANQVDDAPAMSAEQLVAQRRSQLDNAATIRSGLTNAYLYRYRYLSSWSQSNALKELYRNTLQMQEAGAQFFQTIHNGL
ncbi:MAG: TIGR02921 family PEP-CTERM protein, partial [Phormidesmis sp.]